MPEHPSLTFDFEPSTTARRLDPSAPMKLLLIGAFSGEAVGQTGTPLRDRRPLIVDVDNLDSVIERLAPSLALPLPDGGTGAPVTFEEFDDFHPDALYRRVETFAALRSTRKKLLDPATFAEAVRELNLPSEAPADADRDAASTAADSGSAFEQLLGGAATDPAGSAARATTRSVEAIVSSLVAPYVELGADPRQDQYAAIVDTAIGDLMRGLLHAPAFQRLEARWRAVHELITGVETGEDLKVYLLDVDRDELRADLCAPGVAPDQTGLYRQLVEQSRKLPGGEPWSLLVVDEHFGPAPDDVQLLGALGALGAQAGGPVLAGADPALFGAADLWSNADAARWQPLDDDAQALWAALRQSPMAPWIGLAAPRLLGRVPYGAKRDEVDAFAFEETPDDAGADGYLWCNPAFAAATLIAQGFTDGGWGARPGQLLDVQDLPACSVTRDGEAALVPCGEALLSEPAAAAIAAQGIMPVMSHAASSRVRFAGIHSIAQPAAPLAGAWA